MDEKLFWRDAGGFYEQTVMVENPISKLAAGSYSIQSSMSGVFLAPQQAARDNLITLPNSSGDKVLQSIQNFWGLRDKFTQRGLVFKRAFLLYGPPGSGKTSTIHQIVGAFIEQDGLVVWAQRTGELIAALNQIRRIEPKRRVLVVMEDLENFAVGPLTNLLDGEYTLDNIVYVATSNRLSEVDPRLRKRPSRFDEIVEVGMPGIELRERYLLSQLTFRELESLDVNKWAADTEGFGLAHLKELVIATQVLGQEYPVVLDRVRGMIGTEADFEDFQEAF